MGTIDKKKIETAAKAMESYAKFFWPTHRKFVKGKFAKRCTRCASSEFMIPLDPLKQLCSECIGSANEQGALYNKNYSEQNELKKHLLIQLNNILEQAQGSGEGNYDVLIPYSGGKDSAFMVKRIQLDFPKMRILTYTIDNGFMSPVAKDNVEETLLKLNVDHIFVKPQKSFYVKLFRYCITHLNENGSYGTVDFSDGEFMLDNARKIAAEKSIPIILCGYSKYQVQDGLGLNTFESPREVEMQDRKSVAGIPLDKIFTTTEIDCWWHGSRFSKEKIARLLFPLYAWDLEESFIKEQVVKWGLLNEKKNSPLVTNHQLIPLLSVVDVYKFGYTSFEKEFCRMVREGKAKREDWQNLFEMAEYSARTGFFIKNEIIKLLNELNLNLNDVGITFNLPILRS